MLTNLDWIGDGKPWPPEDEDERARLQEHAQMRQVYAGLHEKVFPGYAAYLTDANRDPKKQKIILDWPYMATSSYMHLLLGEEPEVLAGDRTDLPQRPDEQVFIDVSRYGIGLYEISDDGIQIVNPENCYIVVMPGNIQVPRAFVFFSILKKKSKDQNGKETTKEYVKLTIHTKGQIQHQIYELGVSSGPIQSATVGVKVLRGPLNLRDFPEYDYLKVNGDGIQASSADDLLVVAVNNQMTSERYYGRSDYLPSALSLIEVLEKLFSQRAEVLAKFTNPTPILPESAATYDHSKGEWVYRPGKPVIMQPGETAPSLMTWDADLGQVDRAIEQTMDQLLQMLQLSRVLLAGQGAGNAESGTALRIRLIPTLAKVSRFARAYEAAVPKVINLWSQLHGPVIPIESIVVNMQDGIPEYPLETAQAALMWEQMGAISLERKLILQGLKEGSDAFNTELQRLRGSAQASEVQAPRISLPGLEGEGGGVSAG